MLLIDIENYLLNPVKKCDRNMDCQRTAVRNSPALSDWGYRTCSF